MKRSQLVHTVRALLAAIALLGFAAAADAQQVYWDVPGSLGAGQRAALDLVFADTEPSGRVAPPHVDGLSILGPPSEQSSVSIVNGARSLTLTLSFPVRAEREGSMTIPAFDVATSAGRVTVEPLAVQVGAASLPGRGRAAGAKVEDIVEARLTPSTLTPYAGQVFDVEATVGLTGGHTAQVIGVPSWEKSGLLTEPWSAGKQVTTRGGSGVRFQTRALAPQAGRIEVAPFRQDVQIQSGRGGGDPFDGLDDAFSAFRKFGGAGDIFDQFFSRGQNTSATVRSNQAQLDVRPLPQPAPEGFSGAVGQFELESTMVPAQPKTGEPVTWTLTLKGTGNWPGGVALPPRAVPSDFRTLQPKQHKEFPDGAQLSGALSEDLVLIPNQPGDYALAPVRFVYFDPQAERYRTIEAPAPALHVSGAPIAAQPASQPVAAAQSAGAPIGAAAAPAAHASNAASTGGSAPLLPRDALAGSAASVAPIAAPYLTTLIAIPLVLFALYWLTLAVQHARRNDPRRPQREAFRQLGAAIERVRRAASAEERIAALLAWQHTAALALGIDVSAPTVEHLADPRWVEIWKGSERALYQREHALPAAWCERALSVCTRTRRPRFNPLRALSVRHFVPKAATAALLLALAAAPVRATDAVDAYTQGDFAAAREQLVARVTSAPGDWVARYNLGLAEAQQGDSARALGETLAAFVHQPRHDDVRWNAQAFAARVPGFDRTAAALIAAPHLATLASPAVWQGLAVVAVLLGCSGGALVLRRRYRDTGGRAWFAVALILVGIGVGGTAGTSLSAYGRLADSRAALVAGQPVLRSVPTDAEPTQQQKPLPAGTLVVVEQDFLGWVKIGLDGGETGWLRHADLVPLYRAPSA